jgi:saccharopine dehydrogenase-like NADP-dependent oxidoreductase
LIEAFEKSGLTHESYLTGQCAFIFTKMLVNDIIQQKGAIAPEVLNAAERKYFSMKPKNLILPWIGSSNKQAFNDQPPCRNSQRPGQLEH